MSVRLGMRLKSSQLLDFCFQSCNLFGLIRKPRILKLWKEAHTVDLGIPIRYHQHYSFWFLILQRAIDLFVSLAFSDSGFVTKRDCL